MPDTAPPSAFAPNPRTASEAEIGPFAEGARFDGALLTLARRERN
ncbi:MAG TPA: hypothetical protein VND87_00120 [Stellaceae bacterium]|nr:hypothetical protein [Stellaceae bacterium]